MQLNFETANAAFADGHGHAEAARILHDIAERVDNGHETGVIRDINGNTIGRWSLTIDAE
jgi:hypothetical protein